MSIRSVSFFLVSLFAAGVIALAQQPAPPSAPPSPPAPGEPFGAFSLFVDGGSFLGVYAENINRENMSRYGLGDVRGVGITSIVADSPAEKAGLKKDDVILRFDSETVTSVRKLNRLVSEVAPDQTVRLTISRGGAEQDLSVTIGKHENRFSALHGLKGGVLAPGGKWRLERPEGLVTGKEAFAFSFGSNRRIGVSTTTLTKQLADYFGVTEGVLVTSVTDGSPAATAGIKAGDVITAIDGEKIDSAGDLSRAINKKNEGEVTLTVVRDKGQRTIRVTPKEGPAPFIQPGTISKGGRRVVVPRIELPTIPEMNIVIPEIELPVIPEINIDVKGTTKRGAKTPGTARPI